MDESCGSLGVCRWRGRLGHGAPEPAYQLDPGGPEHPRLRQGLRGSGARCLDFRLGRPPPAAAEEDVMEVLHPRCAGLDVHKDGVVAAVRIAPCGSQRPAAAPRSRCAGSRPRHRVCWRPVWHVLSDGDLTLILANAAHVKNVPGRKTDVADAAWLAELLAHGLIRPSFVPEPATAAMRALMRTRKQLVREGASHVQRLQKVLEDANLKLASVLSDIVGVSGRASLRR